MKVAYVSTQDSSDVHAWSGIVYHMLKALRNSGLDVDTIDKLHDPYSALFKAKRVFKNFALNKNYLRDREPLTLHSYARQVERQLNDIKPDIIISPGTIPIAYLRTNIPIIFWTDATFAGMIDFYPEFSNLCNETIKNGNTMEQAALTICRLAIYSSDWAAKTARDGYIVDNNKVKIVPFGANLDHYPNAEDANQTIALRNSGVCKLLLVGVDWNRKGGDIALSVATMLNERGLNTELHVVGCNPPSSVPAFVKKHGYLSKRNQKQNQLLSDLFRTSHFLILPSRAECLACVVAEANAFCLPALTSNVGGLPTAVKNGHNGHAFGLSNFTQECATYIVEATSSKETYQKLCLSSLAEARTRLSWQTAAASVVRLIGSSGALKPRAGQGLQ